MAGLLHLRADAHCVALIFVLCAISGCGRESDVAPPEAVATLVGKYSVDDLAYLEYIETRVRRSLESAPQPVHESIRAEFEENLEIFRRLAKQLSLVTLHLKEDGTYEMTWPIGGETAREGAWAPGTWTLEGDKLTLIPVDPSGGQGRPNVFTVDDGSLVCVGAFGEGKEPDDELIVFRRNRE